MLQRTTSVLLLFASLGSGLVPGCRSSGRVAQREQREEAEADWTRSDLITTLDSRLKREHRRERLEWTGIALGGAALLLASLFLILSRRRAPAPVRDRVVHLGPGGRVGRVRDREEPAARVRAGEARDELPRRCAAGGSDEAFTSFTRKSLEEGTPESALALEAAEGLERLGSLVASGAAPLPETIQSGGLQVAEDWGYASPLVQHLRRTEPVVRRGGDARVDGRFLYAEWLASLAGVALASSWEGGHVDRVLARIGPVDLLERRARELMLAGRDIPRRARREALSLLKQCRKKLRRLALDSRSGS